MKEPIQDRLRLVISDCQQAINALNSREYERFEYALAHVENAQSELRVSHRLIDREIR